MRSFEGHANSRNRTRGVGNWGWPTAKRPTLANHYIFAGLLSILTLTRSNSFKIAFLVAKEWAATVFGDKKFQPKHVQTWDSMLITWNRLFVICSLLIVVEFPKERSGWVMHCVVCSRIIRTLIVLLESRFSLEHTVLWLCTPSLINCPLFFYLYCIKIC